MKADFDQADDANSPTLRLLRAEAERVFDQGNGYYTDEYFDGERYELEHEQELDFDNRTIRGNDHEP